MSNFQIDYEKLDVEAVMAQVRQRVKEKMNSVYTDQDLEQLANIAHEESPNLSLRRVHLHELDQESKWNVNITLEDIYKSSDSTKGKILRRFRLLMRKPFKFIMNIDVLLAAFARQIDFNKQLVESMNYVVVPKFNEVSDRLVDQLTEQFDRHQHLLQQYEIQKGIIEGQRQQVDYLERRLRALEKLAVLNEDAVAAIGQTERKSSDLEPGRYKPKSDK